MMKPNTLLLKKAQIKRSKLGPERPPWADSAIYQNTLSLSLSLSIYIYIYAPSISFLGLGFYFAAALTSSSSPTSQTLVAVEQFLSVTMGYETELSSILADIYKYISFVFTVYF